MFTGDVSECSHCTATTNLSTILWVV